MSNNIPLHPSRKILRKMGYLTDQRGIIRRYLGEEGSWEKHLEKSKGFIQKSARTKQKSCVAVLGSGWLLDVPMDFLRAVFDEILLVDIVHPPQIIHKYSSAPDITFVSKDLTGGAIMQVYSSMAKPKKERNTVKIEHLTGRIIRWDKEIDFYISLNILNQLDILLVDYIRKFKLFDQEQENLYRRIIQSNHLRSLPKGKSCLISDYKEFIINRSTGTKTEKALVYSDFPIAHFTEEWTWDFDLKMRYNPGKQTLFQVKAIDF